MNATQSVRTLAIKLTLDNNVRRVSIYRPVVWLGDADAIAPSASLTRREPTYDYNRLSLDHIVTDDTEAANHRKVKCVIRSWLLESLAN